MMDDKYKIELVQQPANSPFWNILYLAIWQASHLEVNKMNGKMRHREPELVEYCEAACDAVPDVKILQAFEMRKDSAAVLEADGWRNQEGHGRHVAKRGPQRYIVRVTARVAWNCVICLSFKATWEVVRIQVVISRLLQVQKRRAQENDRK